MTNPYYTKTFDVVPGTRITSQAIEDQFLLVEQGADAIHANFPNAAGPVTATHSDINKITGAAAGAIAGFNVATQLAANNTTLAASTAMVQSAILASTGITAVLPAQSGNTGKFLSTDGTSANWAGVVDTFTGADIASAATINLDTTTGNRVHITGTATITAVTLTRGPRTVIFDGILTLTHNATTNNLPGGANITTAAGDRAIYESDGVTVYCVSYARSGGGGGSEITLVAGNGFGSTNTHIRRFTTTQSSSGTDITYADSATLGASFTINTNGLYEVFYVDTSNAGASDYGISINSSQLATPIGGITSSDRLGRVTAGASNDGIPLTRVIRLAVADVIRPHTNAFASPSTTANQVMFSMKKVGV